LSAEPAPAVFGLALATAAWLAAPAQASPEEQPSAWLVQRVVRLEGLDSFLGDGEWGSLAQAWRLRPLSVPQGEGLPPRPGYVPPWLRLALAPELTAVGEGRSDWQLVARPGAALALGTLVPGNHGGDEEPGMLSARALGELSATARGFELLLEPGLGMELGPVGASATLDQAWAAWRSRNLLLGFGLRDRWLGPGRRGALMLSDNARPVPLGTFAAQGRLPGKLDKLGRWRFEHSLGWFQRERSDVDHPGLMLMEARWLPVPWLELGATRLTIFGGEDRTMPGFFELMVPLDPHVEGDPEKDEADQNEMASLDLRLTLPLARWWGGPVDWVEGWWQYGAEDIIARETLGVPYPSLAGVANLYGLEAVSGPWTVSYEGARIFDDYFRWYTGHRVYHDGFTQDGRVLGHHIGGDAEATWLRLGWTQLPWGVEAWYERVLRIGIVESLEQNLFALATDELTRGGGLRLWRGLDQGGQLSLSWTLARVQGVDFKPGVDDWRQRLLLSWQLGPVGSQQLRARQEP